MLPPQPLSLQLLGPQVHRHTPSRQESQGSGVLSQEPVKGQSCLRTCRVLSTPSLPCTPPHATLKGSPCPSRRKVADYSGPRRAGLWGAGEEERLVSAANTRLGLQPQGQPVETGRRTHCSRTRVLVGPGGPSYAVHAPPRAPVLFWTLKLECSKPGVPTSLWVPFS